MPEHRWIALLRRNPAFARLWFAESISLVGDWFSLVAVSALAVSAGGGEGAWAVAVTIAVHELPMGLVRPLGGVLADRFDRRNLLIGIHLIQAILTLAMAERALAVDVPSLQLLLLIRSAVSGVDAPARSGAIRRLVRPEDLLSAHALSGSSWSAMYAFGMSLGGLLASIGTPLALALDALTFLGAALMLTSLPSIPTRGAGRWREAAQQTYTDLREGLRLALSNPKLLRAVTGKAPLGLAAGGAVVYLNLVADREAFAGTAALSLGLMQAVRGLGIGVGPWLAERTILGGQSLLPVWRLAAFTGFAGVAGVAVAGHFGWWTGFTVATFIWGMGTGANWMISSSQLQRESDDTAVGRLSGLDMLLIESCFAVSALCAGALVERTHLPTSAAGLALVLGIAGFVLAQAAASRSAARAGSRA